MFPKLAMNSVVSPNTNASSPKTSGKDDQTPSEIQSKIKQAISLLPREKGFSSFDLCQYQGFWFASSFMENIMLAQEKFHPKPTDIFICSTMKSGTTWLKALCFAIYTRADYDDPSNLILTTNPHDFIPFIEMKLAQIMSRKGEDDSSFLPLISTHSPFTTLPKSILQEGCKIIYICRNPKDTFVSMWHFISKLRKIRGIELIPIKEAFDLFCKGLSDYGPFWDHVLGYWNASLEYPDKVLFLKYEDMVTNTSYYVKKLASFMGFPFSKEEEMEGIVEKIVCMCCFDNLSNLEVNKNGKRDFLDMRNVVENKIYFRKGEIGDWKGYLTEEDGAYLDAMIEEKLQGSGLMLDLSK